MSKQITPAELLERIRNVHGELSYLSDLVHRLATDAETASEEERKELCTSLAGPCPDTDRIRRHGYAMGPPTGLDVAAEAIEGITLEECAAALEPPNVQRERRAAEKASMSPVE